MTQKPLQLAQSDTLIFIEEIRCLFVLFCELSFGYASFTL